MKFSKKMGLALGLSVVLVSSIVSTSMAVDCAKAEVMKAGPNAGLDNGVAIQLKCIDATPVFGTIMVVPPANIADQSLATALTALSLGKTVWVRTGGTVSGSLLNIMYLNK